MPGRTRDEYIREGLQALGMERLVDLDKAVASQRHSLYQVFAARHEEILSVTYKVKETISMLRDRGWNTHADLWNICLYTNLVAHDLSVLVLEIYVGQDYWARNLAARNAALLMFESVKGLTQQLGKPIRDVLKGLGILAAVDLRLRATRAPLDTFRSTHLAQLKAIRNVAAAHRVRDGSLLLAEIESIDLEQVGSLAMEMGGILNDMGTQLQLLINETSVLAPPETVVPANSPT